MRLVISTYIRTLRERGEFDALLPDLLNAMDIVPLSRPSIGTRQFGVDLAAIGPDPDANGERKLFLFVLKQGDISRSMWSSDSPQSVRPTLEEVMDVYLRAHVPRSAKHLPKKVILSTTGDMKEEIVPNWAGFTNDNSSKAEFDFWGADKIALLVQKNLLNESVFDLTDRNDLRRALSLAADPDYSLLDFYNIVSRQLELQVDGRLKSSRIGVKELGSSLVRVNLATRLFGGWSLDGGNSKNSFIAAERSLLWSWHRLGYESKSTKRSLARHIDAIWQTYSTAGRDFLTKFRQHSSVRHGLSGYTHEFRLYGLIAFEILGIIASIGLSHLYTTVNDDCPGADVAMEAARILSNIIHNNPVLNSPPFDGHVVEISLAMSLLTALGEQDSARNWLRHLVRQYDYTMNVRRHFPIGTDSFDDLVEASHGEIDEKVFQKLTSTSWLLPTLAGWTVCLKEEDAYKALVAGREYAFKGVTGQLWHPVESDLERLYFSPLHHDTGETEAPITLTEDAGDHRQTMKELLAIERLGFVGVTSGYKSGRFGIDFVAFRHFRTPVPASYWYLFSDDRHFHLPS